jgi:hypothetical protein
MASDRLRAVANYIRLLLNTSVNQARSLLSTATADQAKALCEVAFNLLKSKVPLKIRKIVKKYKKLLEKLTRKGISIASKIKLLKTHCRQVLAVLGSVKESLMKLI